MREADVINIFEAAGFELVAKSEVNANPKDPANWERGERVIVVPSVPDDEARERHGEFDAPVPYLRYVPQPD